ncbi:DUF2188 domain-containing protein [Cupriavidus sp. RAF12]|uniref:DUF2188 domain-containing protein n=1 Tax=Cupriavidus sp. RAF12 TaxID=3233050 RepID=UPI003F919B3E
MRLPIRLWLARSTQRALFLGAKQEDNMQARIIRVMPAELGWTLEWASSSRPQRFPTLEAAIAAGWALAKRENAELHIHRRDGEVHLRAAAGEPHEPQE